MKFEKHVTLHMKMMCKKSVKNCFIHSQLSPVDCTYYDRT